MGDISSKIDFFIFGATGMQGNIVVRDLVEKGYRIFISSKHQPELNKLLSKYPPLKAKPVNLENLKETAKLIVDIHPSVIINCAEGDWNLNVYQAALEAGCHVIDLGSDIPVTRKQIAMHADFERKNLTAITGCGSTPGINNVMLSYAIKQLDSVDTIEAGFAWNSNIKTFVVPFSMESIIEEFTQAAPIIENGAWIKKIPLETVKEKEFREVGVQKNFLVRHPETETFFSNYKDLGLQNVRFYAGFPEHSFNTIRSYLNGDAFPENGEIYIEGKGLIPLAGLTKILQELHKPPPGYTEKENLWVSFYGLKDNIRKHIMMECIVPTLSNWKDAGCNIDTGFPASIIGQMIFKKNITQGGSFAPEAVIPHADFFNALREREMTILMNGKEIN